MYYLWYDSYLNHDKAGHCMQTTNFQKSKSRLNGMLHDEVGEEGKKEQRGFND